MCERHSRTFHTPQSVCHGSLVEANDGLVSLAADRMAVVTRRDLERMSHLSTPPQVIAVYDMPEECIPSNIGVDNLALVLDGIQDPGNMGTIMRVADWFGVETSGMFSRLG